MPHILYPHTNVKGCHLPPISNSMSISDRLRSNGCVECGNVARLGRRVGQREFLLSPTFGTKLRSVRWVRTQDDNSMVEFDHTIINISPALDWIPLFSWPIRDKRFISIYPPPCFITVSVPFIYYNSDTRNSFTLCRQSRFLYHSKLDVHFV